MLTKTEFILHGLSAFIIYFFLTPFFCIYGLFSDDLNSWRKRLRSLTGCIAIVTGANTGIGKRTAAELALKGATVILACRDRKKGERAVNDIREEISSSSAAGSVLFMSLDLSDLSSVVSFVESFKKRFTKLDILVNNAGLNQSGRTPQGLQQLFQVNYLGHFMLSRLLIPVLSRADGSSSSPQEKARIINLSSVMHHNGQPDFKASSHSLYSQQMKSQYSYYSDSKLYTNLMTFELNRRHNRLASSSEGLRPVLTISVNPGAVRSDIWRNVPKFVMFVYDLFMRAFYLSCEEGCATSIYAAAGPDPTEGISGRELEEKGKDSKGREAYRETSPCLASTEAGREIPYLVPYYTAYGLVALEMIGKYSGPKWGRVSMPKGYIELSESLYYYSESLCKTILGEKIDFE